jgi:hypothetical protein
MATAVRDLLEAPDWMMLPAERVALEGLLAGTRPALAIELGTARGGSLRRICAHSDEVHSFDLAPELPEAPPNATLHIGDCHVLLPKALSAFEAEGRNVDFVLVDGDHTPSGVRQDLEDLLGSGALRSTVIVLHDVLNEFTRAGIESVDLAAYPRLEFVGLDFLTRRVSPRATEEVWGGLGLMIVGRPGAFAGRLVRPADETADGGRLCWLARPWRRARRALRTLVGHGRRRYRNWRMR